MAGPDGVHSPGHIVDLPNDKAIEMMQGGYADAVREIEIETAVMPEYEKAVKRKKAMRGE